MDHNLAYYLNILLNEKAVPIQARYMKSYTDCDEMLERQSLVEKALIEEIKKVAKKKHQKGLDDLINIPYFHEDTNYKVHSILQLINEIPVVYIKYGTGLSSICFPIQEGIIKEGHTLFAHMENYSGEPLLTYILLRPSGVRIQNQDFKVFFDFNFENNSLRYSPLCVPYIRTPWLIIF